ncbi:metallophosphoesterase [Nitrosomonas communis]|uniref:Calcineurin-like phosphoesterase n=1 Tax=Nitrosomonas communis TaxID=44574 RepID=A0A1I4PWC7_9PROT|nr:metallophosphoesterase [Nitrosomonas communis]SFM32097.1 Calcineurin-like phosphoesterase [Nitrosomonas communis]
MVQFRFFIISTLLLVFFLTTAPAQSRRIESEGVKPFEFALIGDVPYANVDFRKFDNLIKEINADQKLEWVLHAGDIKTGLSPCSDELLRDRLERFQQFQLPFILTPGDNEWTDCHRFTAGSYQPLERLAYLRKLFYPQPGVSLGQRTMTVTTQARDPDFSEFVENVRWKKNLVVFATLHIVGSNNGLLPFSARTQADDDEVKRRINAALSWIKQTFTEARKSNARGVFLLFQANPRFELAKGNDKRLGFEEILNVFEQESVEFGKPVILAHGDSHHFRLDKPLFSSGTDRKRIENVTRIETFGDRDINWVRVVVDPNSPEVFIIHQQIAEKN